MKQIETEIIINTRPDKVWQVLTDFDSHPDWNPFIKSIVGRIKVGEKISVTIQPPDGKSMTFKPTILAFQKENELRWIGRLLVKGIFDGEHYFILRDEGNGHTKFIQGEKFSGILVAFTGTTLEKTKTGFELMNEALKKECEKA